MRLGFRHVIYASGNFGKNILWGTTEATLLFVLTDLLGVAPAVAGSILLCSLFVDAALDPLIGHAADQVRSSWGRYGPFLLFGAPLCGLTFSALYALPFAGIHDTLVITLLVIAFRVGYSFIDLPHNALMTHVSQDSRVRGRLAGYRFFFSALASLTLALALTPIVGANTQDPVSPRGLAIFGALASVASTVVMIAAWYAVRREDRSGIPAASIRPPFRKALASLWSSPPYRMCLAAGAIATMTLPLFSKAIFYLAIHVLNSPQWAARFFGAMVLGQFVGLPLWIALSSRWEKARTLQVAHATVIAGLLFFASVLHSDVYLATVAAGITGMGASGVYTVIWGMIADCVEDVISRSSISPEGLLFALSIFVQKAGIALSIGLFGYALQAANYQPAGPVSAAAAWAIQGFGIAVPVLGSAICIGLLMRYGLTHRLHERLAQENPTRSRPP